MYSITSTHKPGIASSKRWPFALRKRIRILPQALSMLFGALFLMGVHVALAQEQMGSDFRGTDWSYGGFFQDATALSADGTILAIGDQQLLTGGGYPGYVQVFEWNGSDWQQLGNDLIGEACSPGGLCSGFGGSVSLSSDGQIMAVGADHAATRVYEWNGSEWVQMGGDIGFAGSHGLLTADGSVLFSYVDGERRFYEWGGSEWIQRGDGIVSESRGWVSLSSDGKVFAVGDGGYSPSSSLFFAGRVQVFEWNDTTWAQRGDDMVGTAQFEGLGSTVSLSGDAQVLAVSVDKSPTRVYDWNGTTWVQRGDDIGDARQWSRLSSDGRFILNGHNLYEWKDGDWVEIVSIPGTSSNRYVISSDASVVARVIGSPFEFQGSTVRVYRTGVKVVANEKSPGIPKQYALTDAYPNPFNPATTFSLTLERTQPVRVSVVDLLGRELALLHEGVLAAGATQVFTFEAGGLPSGQYLIRVVGESFVASRGVVLVK